MKTGITKWVTGAVIGAIIPPLTPALADQPTAPNQITTRITARPTTHTTGAEAPSRATFKQWLAPMGTRAQAAGISPDTITRAFAGIRYDADVVHKDRTQSEFTKAIWDYLDTAVSDARVHNGRAAMARHADTFAALEKRYGVEPAIIAAIWGLESAYGAVRGNLSVIQSLASLAYDGRRGAFFEAELIDALRILEAGDTVPETLRGSWAGASGHTQFMPSSFWKHAVDGTGDGRRDLWSDDPRDALASTAAYLVANGWQTGVPWGIEATVPEGFDYTLARRDLTRTASEWAALGVTGARETPPDDVPLSLLLPAGAAGAAFLISANFEVIESYNTADAYVIAVGHLADRLRGGDPIQHPWPRTDRVLTYDERIELQERLTKVGFDTQGIDAKMGPLTINAIRNWQVARGELPDGYPSLRLLEKLRAGR